MFYNSPTVDIFVFIDISRIGIFGEMGTLEVVLFGFFEATLEQNFMKIFRADFEES